MTVKEYLKSTYSDDKYNIRNRIVCKDGFSISVQGGTSFHYCNPRELCNFYEELECGFPSSEEKLLTPYQDGNDSQLDDVFAYVPIEIVEEIIKKHGGIK